MRRSLQTAAVLGASALAVALSAACTPSSSPSAGTSASSAAATTASGGGTADAEDVAWVDKICGELVELGEGQQGTPPSVGDLRDASTAIPAVTEYVDANIDNVERAIAGLRDVGPSPIDGGDETIAALERGLSDLKATYEATRKQVLETDPNDQQAVQFAILTALGGLNEGGAELRTAYDSLRNNEELASAVRESDSCQRVATVAEAVASAAVTTALSVIPTT